MRTIRHSSLVLFMFSFVLHQAIAQWVQTKGPYGGSVNLVWAQGSTLYAATDAGLYRSTDRGANWVDPALTTTRVHAFLAVGTTVLAGTDVGIYRTTDNGATWARPSASLQTTSVNAFAVIGSRLFAGTNDGIYRSTDGGATWNSIKNWTGEIVLSLAVLPNAVGGTRLVAGCLTLNPFGQVHVGGGVSVSQRIRADGTIYSSSDEGTTWKHHNDFAVSALGGSGYGWAPSEFGRTLLVSGNRLFARRQSYGWWPMETTHYLNFKSDIDKWEEAPDLAGRFLGQSGIVTSNLFLVDPDGFVCLLDSTVTDATLQENPAPTKLGFAGKQAQSLAKIPGGTGTPPSASGLFVATADRGMWQSTDEGRTWTEANSGFINSNVRALTCLGNGTSGSPAPVVAATNLLRDALGKSHFGMYTSTDQGTVWSAATSGPADTVTCMTSLAIGTTGRAILAGTNSGLYVSTDGGMLWTQMGYLPVVGLATAVVQGKPTLFVAHPGALTSTTDIQSSLWTTILGVGYGTPLSGVFTSLNLSGNPVIYTIYKDRIDYSEDNGTTFQNLFQLFGSQVNGLARAGNEVFVATNRGIHRRVVNSQGYTSWVRSYDRVKVNAIITCGSQVFAGTDSLGVLFSLDDGATWYPVNSGLTASRITSFAYDGVSLYVGTQGRGVFRYNSPLGVNPSIAPSAPASTSYGSTFWVDVVAGNPDNVTDLWDFWFDLVSDNAGCTYVDSSGTYGALMTQGFTPQIPRTLVSSAAPNLVHFDIQRKTSSGVTGSGVIARAQFKAPPVPSGGFTEPYATFSIKNFAGRNSKKERFYFHPSTFTVKFFKAGITVWPGDCNADGVVNANDILPLGVYYLASEYFPENQGILWQGYNRQPWTTDTPPKKVHADANGDRNVNSADLLAVGLNYGKTHSAAERDSVHIDDPSLSKIESDGRLSFVSVTRESGKLRANLRLSASKPVYGIGFTLKYGLRGMSAETLRFIQIDTAQSVLGGGLIFSKPFDADGHAEIAMTRTDKVGFTGDGALLSVSFEAPAGVEDALRLEICQVVANDANGNPVSITGSVYQNSVTGLLEVVPLRNELYQNYPNPFNPSTLIRFELSSRASVSLKIYDALGRELTLLTNGVLPAGMHSAVWDGSSYPSGVYFCVLRINEENRQVFMQTRRMMLVK